MSNNKISKEYAKIKFEGNPSHLLFCSFSTSSQTLLDLTSSSGSVYFASSAIVFTWSFNQAKFIAPFKDVVRSS